MSSINNNHTYFSLNRGEYVTIDPNLLIYEGSERELRDIMAREQRENSRNSSPAPLAERVTVITSNDLHDGLARPLLERIPNLTSIDFSLCSGLTDEAVRALAERSSDVPTPVAEEDVYDSNDDIYDVEIEDDLPPLSQ